ncbi:C4-dicarboxylate transporter DcuC [Trueperella sp. LYQ143]|uniref:C4-dicarboxylate transporter DcuC n=1 Tax=unclassified Trueperella TaxID=2630174 RepID=UPI003982F539
MSAVLTICAIMGVIAAGYFLIKGHKPVIVLLLTGIILTAVSVIAKPDLQLLDEKATSGSRFFDIFTLFEKVAGSQLTGVGLIIMAAGGFSAYMNKIGASRALVSVAARPIAKIHKPYLLLMVAYLLGQVLFMVIPSAAGLAILLLVLLVPILTEAGVTPAAAAAVIATSSGLPMGPATGTTVLAADTAKMSPVVYFTQNQLLVAVPAMIAVMLTHYFTQRYFDRKGTEVYQTPVLKKQAPKNIAPRYYALFLVLPIAMLVIFSPLTNDNIELSTVTAFFITWLLAVIVELIRRRESAVLAESTEFFSGMGSMFASVVSLIIAAQIFAQGITHTGVIAHLIEATSKVGAGMVIVTILFTLIVGIVTFLTGSGVGAFSAFAKLAPDVSAGLGGSTAALVTPMQFASGLFRSFSPIAGVVIAVAGGVGISPIALVKRTLAPMLVGIIVMLAASLILL